MFEDVTRLHGLFAATFTPMDERGALRLAAVPDYVAHLRQQQIAGLYIADLSAMGGRHRARRPERSPAAAEPFASHRQQLSAVWIASRPEGDVVDARCSSGACSTAQHAACGNAIQRVP